MFNPARLALARRRRGLSISALANLANISAKSLSTYENEHRQPTAETIQSLSKALNFPLKFFHIPDTPEVPESGVTFRARTKVAAYKKNSAIAAAELAVDVSKWIDANFNTPDADLPSLNYFSAQAGSGRSEVDVDSAAEVLRARWGLGSGPIGNMIHLLEAHGVRVFSLTGEAAEVDAFSFWNGRRPFVLLNTMKSGERGRFDAAHELGHLILHSSSDGAKSREVEREADRFASAFLMPEADIRAHVGPYASIEFILKAKERWRVAAIALTYRLRELDLLSDWVYRETCIQLSRLGYRSSEPGGISRETSQLLSKALRGAGLRNFSRVASDLMLTPEDLNNLVFGLMVTALDGERTLTGKSFANLRILDEKR